MNDDFYKTLEKDKALYWVGIFICNKAVPYL